MRLLRLIRAAALFTGEYALCWLTRTSLSGYRVPCLLIVHLRRAILDLKQFPSPGRQPREGIVGHEA